MARIIKNKNYDVEELFDRLQKIKPFSFLEMLFDNKRRIIRLSEIKNNLKELKIKVNKNNVNKLKTEFRKYNIVLINDKINVKINSILKYTPVRHIKIQDYIPQEKQVTRILY